MNISSQRSRLSLSHSHPQPGWRARRFCAYPATFFTLLATCAIFCGTSAHLYAADTKPPLYIVLYRLVVAEDGKLQSFQLEKIIDLLSGSNEPASVKLPGAFTTHAKKMVEGLHLKPTIVDGKPGSVLTTFIYAPADEKSERPPVAFSALNGVMNVTSDLRLLGQDGQVSAFGTNIGNSVIGVNYYALPLPKTKKDQRETIIEAEVQRNSANVQNVEILSRRNLSTDSQTILEFSFRSLMNKALTIRARYICSEYQMVALSAVTPDGLSAEDARAFDQLFEAFHFR